jgi:hypothetical protein
MLNLGLYDGESLWVGDIHIPKVQGFRLNQMFGPIDEIQAHGNCLGNWLKVTSYKRALSVAMCSHELNPQSLLCTINSVQYIQILNFDSDQSPRNI